MPDLARKSSTQGYQIWHISHIKDYCCPLPIVVIKISAVPYNFVLCLLLLWRYQQTTILLSSAYCCCEDINRPLYCCPLPIVVMKISADHYIVVLCLLLLWRYQQFPIMLSSLPVDVYTYTYRQPIVYGDEISPDVETDLFCNNQLSKLGSPYNTLVIDAVFSYVFWI